jgi:hypothetical protein
MPRLGLGEHRSDESLKQIDSLVGQCGAELKSDRHQGGMAALPLIAGDMLGRCPSGVAANL